MWKVINISMTEKTINERALLNINELCDYLEISKTKARELLKTPRNGFSLNLEQNGMYIKIDQMHGCLISAIGIEKLHLGLYNINYTGLFYEGG